MHAHIHCRLNNYTYIIFFVRNRLNYVDLHNEGKTWIIRKNGNRCSWGNCTVGLPVFENGHWRRDILSKSLRSFALCVWSLRESPFHTKKMLLQHTRRRSKVSPRSTDLTDHLQTHGDTIWMSFVVCKGWLYSEGGRTEKNYLICSVWCMYRI